MTVPVAVRIFAMPMAACDPGKTWKAAADMIRRRLRERYADAVQVEFVEVFSAESFQYPDILRLVEEGREAPFVTVDGNLVQSGGKLSESVIRHSVDARLTTHNESISGDGHDK